MAKRSINPEVNRGIKTSGFASVIVVEKGGSGVVGLASSTPNPGSGQPLGNYFLRDLPLSKGQQRALSRMVVRKRPGRDKTIVAAAIESEAAYSDKPIPRYFPRLGMWWGYIDKAGLDNLSTSAQVEAIHQATPLSLIVPPLVGPSQSTSSTTEAIPWNLSQFKPLWDQGLRGKGVIVGHLDTGVDGGHETFQGKTIRFLEVDSNGDSVGPSMNKPRDSGRHGTHTAATICGGPCGATSIGVAPDAELASAMVIEGGKTELRTLAALEWMLEQNVQIINLSMGWIGYNPLFEDVFVRLREQGVIPVVAIGNEGPHVSRSPGNYTTSLSVGAVDRAGSVPTFSGNEVFNRNQSPIKPDIVAPGMGIISARAGGGLISMDGTSMAAPHVTGLISLLLGVPGATPAIVESVLLTTASPLEAVSRFRQGNGKISPEAALRELQGL